MAQTAMTKRAEALTTIRDLVSQSQDEFRRALPRHLDPDRFLRIALTAIRQTPKLLDCTPQSLVAALMQSAQLGLEPDGILGHAYLIPYRDNKKGTTEAQFQVGYKGLISLARRSGEVQSFQAQVVYENDKFDFAFGIDERLEHIPAGGDRGEMVAAYAIVKFKDGGHAFDVMFREDIEKVKRSSKAADSGPWKTHEPEMWRKTVAKRLCKYLPLSVELQRAASLDEHNDLGPIDVTPHQDKGSLIEGRFGGGEPEPEAGEEETPDDTGEEGDTPEPITEAQLKKLNTCFSKMNITGDERLGWLKTNCKVTVASTADLTKVQAMEAIDKLELRLEEMGR